MGSEICAEFSSINSIKDSILTIPIRPSVSQFRMSFVIIISWDDIESRGDTPPVIKKIYDQRDDSQSRGEHRRLSKRCTILMMIRLDMHKLLTSAPVSPRKSTMRTLSIPFHKTSKD
ncbi:hypothetical protein MTR67_040300 [Solanum verrucosum]|uniref:Uncharacterized protein n=1 Tax=Solanum verrucosum TaxID=315347 RepID=A0AAF0UIC5_SOLVR|nr:hypothetical protein MTR67_040300 [Solanum verrucosum]